MVHPQPQLPTAATPAWGGRLRCPLGLYRLLSTNNFYGTWHGPYLTFKSLGGNKCALHATSRHSFSGWPHRTPSRCAGASEDLSWSHCCPESHILLTQPLQHSLQASHMLQSKVLPTRRGTHSLSGCPSRLPLLATPHCEAVSTRGSRHAPLTHRVPMSNMSFSRGPSTSGCPGGHCYSLLCSVLQCE